MLTPHILIATALTAVLPLFTPVSAQTYILTDLSLSDDPLQSYCGIKVSNNFCGCSGQTVLESGGRTCAQVAALVSSSNSQGAGTELTGELCGEPLNVVYPNSGPNVGKAVVEYGGDSCADGCVIAYGSDGDGSCSE